MPRHVAFIMDGNGRWAKARSMPRSNGHRQGAQTMLKLIEYCADTSIEVITLYAFSTENWTRPQEEVDQLMGMVVDFFRQYANRVDRCDVRVHFLGDLTRLPAETAEACRQVAQRTESNQGLICNIALNYGGRAEILRAARLFAKKAIDENISPETLDERDFEAGLYTVGQPDVDLLIRTAGERRLSGFLLYQCAYAEFVFVPEFWPDFTPEVFNRALADYAGRQRRMGGLIESGV